MSIEEEEHGSKRNKGQFVDGKSGNPKGRPRKTTPSFSEAARKAQNEKVTVNKGGRKRQMTKRELAAAQLANKGANGDMPALRLLSRLEGDGSLEPPPTPSVTLAEADIAMVARLIARIRATAEGEP